VAQVTDILEVVVTLAPWIFLLIMQAHFSYLLREMNNNWYQLAKKLSKKETENGNDKGWHEENE
jgi:hypothetical protein